MITLYAWLTMLLFSFDDMVSNEWASKVEEVSRISLERNLLTRDLVVMHLSVNLDSRVSN